MGTNMAQKKIADGEDTGLAKMPEEDKHRKGPIILVGLRNSRL